MSPIDPQNFFHDPLQSLERLLSKFDNQGVIIGGIAVSLLGQARILDWVTQFAELLERPELWEDIAGWLQ